jgi:hypothetical protein
MRSFINCTLPKYYYGDEIMENEMGGTCSTYMEMRNAYKFIRKISKVIGCLGELGVDWRIILNYS